MTKNRSIALAFAAGVSVTVFLVSLPAWALSCNACVDASDIVDSQVKAAEIAAGAVAASEIATGAVAASEIATNAVGTSELAPGSVRATDLGVLPAVRVCASTGQVIEHQTSEMVLFDAESFDASGMHGAGSARLTAPVPGIYDVRARVAWPTNATGVRGIALLKNGSQLDATFTTPNSGVSSFGDASALVALAAGEFIEVTVFQNSGVSLTLLTFEDCRRPSLEMHLVSAG